MRFLHEYFSSSGISRSESKDIRLDYSLGKLTFVDTPDVIEDGAVMEGKVGECVIFISLKIISKEGLTLCKLTK